MTDIPKKLTREELYDLIWSKPSTKLATDLGMAYGALTKLCQDLNIPKPPSGYWQQVEFGYTLKRPSLPEIQSSIPSEVILKPQLVVTSLWLENLEIAAK